jgi:hypothetical protein
MKPSEIKLYLSEMEHLGVSKVARSPRGFLTFYLANNGRLNEEWQKKRNSFIARTYASYRKKPSYRRFLSLVAWAFYP